MPMAVAVRGAPVNSESLSDLKFNPSWRGADDQSSRMAGAMTSDRWLAPSDRSGWAAGEVGGFDPGYAGDVADALSRQASGRENDVANGLLAALGVTGHGGKDKGLTEISNGEPVKGGKAFNGFDFEGQSQADAPLNIAVKGGDAANVMGIDPATLKDPKWWQSSYYQNSPYVKDIYDTKLGGVYDAFKRYGGDVAKAVLSGGGTLPMSTASQVYKSLNRDSPWFNSDLYAKVEQKFGRKAADAMGGKLGGAVLSLFGTYNNLGGAAGIQGLAGMMGAK